MLVVCFELIVVWIVAWIVIVVGVIIVDMDFAETLHKTPEFHAILMIVLRSTSMWSPVRYTPLIINVTSIVSCLDRTEPD